MTAIPDATSLKRTEPFSTRGADRGQILQIVLKFQFNYFYLLNQPAAVVWCRTTLIYGDFEHAVLTHRAYPKVAGRTDSSRYAKTTWSRVRERERA